MVLIAKAFTAPVNPSSSSAKLDRASLFRALQRKIRFAHEFVPLITSCKVLEEKGNEITREVTFKEGEAKSGKPVKEVCVEFAEVKVDFRQTDGTTISNIISSGPDGELYLTYSFEWRHEDVQENSEEAEKLDKAHERTAKIAVMSTLETARKLLEEGRI